MSETKRVKVFRNGASQAVRLPADFRFEAAEIYATRDEASGDVVLSTRPGARAWTEFFALARSVKNKGEFMKNRPLNRRPRERALFDGEA